MTIMETHAKNVAVASPLDLGCGDCSNGAYTSRIASILSGGHARESAEAGGGWA
jgi:hypothetical protein